ncbi:MAG: anaerobic ribonucleoside-triphosphate reductase activating protein [Candidatus Omnitrophica bacterium]|nr:anaerobic ribonucleoside-triphosphate reductase activating protein [Candidatus Omnitrophota bacterium]
MLLGGLLKFTLIDYPGRLAAVLFTQGCNFRCPFCHNPELVLPDLFHAPLGVEEVFVFLEKRRGQLQGIVVTGGEPTLHPDLPEFLARIKALGYLVKLDTNGSRPDVVRKLAEARLVDYWAMDIKSSLANYCKASGVEVDLEAIKTSIAVIKAAGVEYEFRTTALKGLVDDRDIVDIGSLLGSSQPYHVRRGNLQGKILDSGLADRPDYSVEEWARIQAVKI